MLLYISLFLFIYILYNLYQVKAMDRLSLNSISLLLFCSDLLVDEDNQLFSYEWYTIVKKLKEIHKEPGYLFDLNRDTLLNILCIDEEIVEKMLMRQKQLSSLLHTLNAIYEENIYVTTIYEDHYPDHLSKLKNKPLFIYYSGDLLLNDHSIALLGNHISKRHESLIDLLLYKCLSDNYTLLLNNSNDYALKKYMKMNGKAVLIVKDHLFDLSHKYKKLIQNNQLLILSTSDPYSYSSDEDNVTYNELIIDNADYAIILDSKIKDIYYQSVVQSKKHNISNQLIYNRKDYLGNLELIALGYTPINDEDIQSVLSYSFIYKKNEQTAEENIKGDIDQMNIFDFIS